MDRNVHRLGQMGYIFETINLRQSDKHWEFYERLGVLVDYKTN